MGKSEKNKPSFEEQWQGAFLNEKMDVPAGVWTKIESELNQQQLMLYKRKAVVYQWAASIAILFATGIVLFTLFNQKGPRIDQSIHSSAINYPIERPVPIDFTTSFLFASGKKNLPKNESNAIQKSTPFLSINIDNQIDASQGALFIALESEHDQSSSRRSVLSLDREMATRRDIPELWIKPFYVPEPPTPAFLFKRINSGRSNEKYWAGVGLGSSTFNPNYQQNNVNVLANSILADSRTNFINTSANRESANPVSNENMSNGIHYQAGLNVGMRLTQRITLEGGIRYSQMQVFSETNLTVDNRYFEKTVAITGDAAAIRPLNDLAESGELVKYSFEEVSLRNQFRFAALPIKAGYIILDRKFSVRFNAGLLTNFYLGNTLSDKKEDFATVNLSPGTESPYRNISFSGLTSLAFGYQLFDQLDLIMEPNYSMAIQSITKSSSHFAALPTTMGINAGIRFNFR